MKKTIIITVFSLLAQTALSQDALFKKYEDMKGVESVYVSKTLLSLAAGSLNVGDFDLKTVVGKIDHIRVMNCEDGQTAQRIKADALAELKKDRHTELLRRRDGDEQTYIYVGKSGGMNEYVLLNIDGREVQVVNITGTLTAEDIQRITR